MMMPLFIIVIIFGVVSSQNHDVNLQTPYSGMTRKRSVEATTLVPPDPHVQDEGIQLLLTRLESLCTENLQYLITDTNLRFQSLENKLSQSSSCPASPVVQNIENLEVKVENLRKQFNTETQKTIEKIQEVSSEVHSTVDNMRDELGQNNKNLETKVEDLGKQFNIETQKTIEKIQEVSSEVNSTVDNMRDEPCQNNKNLETNVENLGKQFLENIQELMDATRSLPSDVEVIKRNVSYLINVTRSLVNLSSDSELKQIFNVGLQELKDLQRAPSTSCPRNLTLDKQYPRNCREVQEYEKTASGIYKIQPKRAPKPFNAVCDLETRGGGWTVIQNRFDGSQDFDLDWENYKNGFGSLEGEFWLGLENIHLLTGFEVNELLIELGDFESQNISAFYSEFNIGSEEEGYSLKVLGNFSGDGGDSLIRHSGKNFTTKDKDQDDHLPYNCAIVHGGAWWHHACVESNLNGKYTPTEIFHTIRWLTFKNNIHRLKYTRMLVRPKV